MHTADELGTFSPADADVGQLPRWLTPVATPPPPTERLVRWRLPTPSPTPGSTPPYSSERLDFAGTYRLTTHHPTHYGTRDLWTDVVDCYGGYRQRPVPSTPPTHHRSLPPQQF